MPLRDDLIQRTIEQIVQVLRWVLGRERSFEEAMAVIDQAYLDHTGSSRSLVALLPSEDLLAILGAGGAFDREKGYLIATLLWAEGQLLEAEQVPVRPELRLKALDLYLETALAGLVEADLPERVASLLEALDDTALPEATLRRLFDYRFERGGYAGAQEALLEWVERFGPNDAIARRGDAFYRELQALERAELERGGLTPGELERGHEAYRRALYDARS